MILAVFKLLSSFVVDVFVGKRQRTVATGVTFTSLSPRMSRASPQERLLCRLKQFPSNGRSKRRHNIGVRTTADLVRFSGNRYVPCLLC